MIDFMVTGLFPSVATNSFTCSATTLRSIVASVDESSSSKDRIELELMNKGGMTSTALMKHALLTEVRSHSMPRLLGKSTTAAMFSLQTFLSDPYKCQRTECDESLQ